MSNTTEHADIRVLSAAEFDQVSGGVLKEIIIGLYVNWIYDLAKNGGGTMSAAIKAQNDYFSGK